MFLIRKRELFTLIIDNNVCLGLTPQKKKGQTSPHKVNASNQYS